MKNLIRYVYYPTVLGMAWASFFIIHRLYPNIDVKYISYGITTVSVLVVWASEYLLPYRREWLADQGDFKLDFFFTNILFPIVAKVGEVLISVALIFFLSEQSRKGIAAYWPSHLPLAVQFIMILLLCEFIYYWLHRAAHTWIPLWNFHSIHHSVKRVYWNNAGRFHPIDLGLNTFLYVSPFFIFAVPEILLALFVITNAVTGLLEHANIDFRLGQLNRIFNSAELHRWHHSLESKESNSNYGKILSFWDQVFGSYHYDGNRGVGGVGVRGDGVPMKFWKQMTYPIEAFKKKS